MRAVNPNHLVRLQHRFDVPVERLFRAWSDPDELASWAWGSLGRSTHADVNFTVGGTFRVVTARDAGETWSFSGQYTRIEPNVCIAHTLEWQAPMGYEAVPECVEIRFLREGAGSLIDFLHTGVPDEKSAGVHAQGWNNSFEALAAHLARSPEIIS